MKQDIKKYRTIIAVILLATAMAAYLSFAWSRRDAIDALRRISDARLDHVSLSVFAPADKYTYLPALLSNDQAFKDALLQPQEAQRIRKANVLLEQMNANAGSSLIYLLGLDGKTIATSNWNTPDNLVGNSYGFRPYFLDAVRHGEGRFYGMGVTTGVPGYYVSHLLRDGSRALGVVVVKVDLRDLAQGWSQYEDEVVVTDRNDVIFLSSRDEWRYRPMWPLADAAREHMKSTRQYDSVLREPLQMRTLEKLEPDEQIVSILQKDRGGDSLEQVHYFLKSRDIEGSDWTIRVLIPMTESDAAARRSAIFAVGAVGIFLLTFMYLQLLRVRHREREESRRALEQALAALEEKHCVLQAVSEELRLASITDPLTGAFNRRFFMQSAEKMASSARRHGYPLALVLIDADHFKQINDVHGHPAGDKVLQTLTAICREELREADIFARFGGEEFIMALPHTDARTALAVAERLRTKVMNHPVEIDGTRLCVTVSSGVAEYRSDEDDLQATIKRADEALYEAKNNGRNQVAATA